MFPAVAEALEQFANRLAALNGQLDQSLVDGLLPVRDELELLQSEAEGWGNDPLAAALRRLSLLTEVWECLAVEDAGSAADVGSFCKRVVEELSQTVRSGSDRDLSWVEQESAERWGSYLGLLGSGPADPPEEVPPPGAEEPAADDDQPSSIDLNSLLRLLTRDPILDEGPLAEPGEEPPTVLFAPRDSKPPPASDADEESAQALPDPLLAAPPGPPESILAPLLQLEPELREAFLADASDLFERIQGLVLEDLSRAGNRAKTLRELSRCYHTLKGAAGSVGLSELVSRIHELEDRLEEASQGGGAVPVDLLHESLGYLESVLYSLRKEDVASPVVAPRTPKPRSFLQNELPTPPLAAPLSVEVDPGSAPNWSPSGSSAADASVRVSCARIDELMDLVSELILRRGVWAAQVETMRQFAATARLGRNRLLSSIDRLRNLAQVRATPSITAEDADGLVRRLAEQAEDLAALAETARAAADPLADDADALAGLSLRLWDALQAVRVVPVRGLFHRLARVAREAARVEGRPIEVVLLGEDAGLDRSVQDRAFEPLLHAVRNAVGHGIEPVQERIRAGKPPLGRITLEAHREGYTLVLQVQDDGRGLDFAAITARGRSLGLLPADQEPTPEQLNALVFQPGFSTRATADSIAGRGVGMDVIAQEVGRLHGTVTLRSQAGVGTTLILRLPARLALEQAMVVRVADWPLALPLSAIELARPWVPGDQDGPDSVRLRDRTVRLVDARRALGLDAAPPWERPKLLVVRAEGQSVALRVDAIEGPRELVIKPLGALLAGHPVIAGTSLSPAGELILVLDPVGLVRHRLEPAATESRGLFTPAPTKVLVVDDALSVRRAARRHLRALGLETEEAADGVEALRKARCGSYCFILSDLEMPRMDGFELLAELNRSGVSSSTPVVIISARSDPQTARRVLSLGARALLPKPLGPDALGEAIAPLLPAAIQSPSQVLSQAATPQFEEV